MIAAVATAWFLALAVMTALFLGVVAVQALGRQLRAVSHRAHGAEPHRALTGRVG